MRRLAFASLLIANVALASGSIGGRVTSSGKPLAGVSVTAATAAMPKPFAAITAANGAYALPALPPGTYDVTFSLAGHQTLTRRAAVRGFERARIDAELEVSEEGESVTQTAMTRDVNVRPASVWTLDRETIDKLPVSRSIGELVTLAPGLGVGAIGVDGNLSFPFETPAEAVEEVAVVFAGAAADEGWFAYSAADTTTRGRREFQATLRETITRLPGDTSELHEASVGGLWMFAAGEAVQDFRSGFARAIVAPTMRDTATVSLLTSNFYKESVRGTWLHVAPRFSALGHVSRDYSALRAYTLAGGAHEVGAGVERFQGRWGGFARDRWDVSNRLVVEGGLRYSDDTLQPRAGVVFDPRGDGVTRLIASYAKFPFSDEASIGVARRLGSSGYARATVIRFEGQNSGTLDGVLHYLFFTFGASATVFDTATFGNAWVVIDPPLPGHDLSVSLMQRYFAGFSGTDLSVLYAYPREHVSPFVKLEVVNVFDRNDDPLFRIGPTGRTFRLGVGLRM